jgi:hypothetical protein
MVVVPILSRSGATARVRAADPRSSINPGLDLGQGEIACCWIMPVSVA